eukprot:g12840.t1
MMWKARIVLSVIGQLIAVPAALFFMPTTYPNLFSATTTADSPAENTSVTFVEPTTAETTRLEERLEEVAQSGAGELLTKMDKKKQKVEKERRRQGGGDGGASGKGKGMFRRRRSGGGEDLRGLDVFLNGLEEAAGGVREAIVATIVHPLKGIPRRAGGAFSTLVNKKGSKEEDPAPASDSRTNKYLAELQLAQESAERALGAPGWEEVAQRNGVTVWKKYFPKDEYGYKYPCVKARGIIEGSAAEVMGMIVDSTRVLEYNRYSKGRTDIEHLGPHTKIVWNKAQPPLSKKLHDFCTLMHMQPLDDEEGSFMLITRATEHPKAPLLDGHVRSEILLGVTILRPAKGDPTRTEMTTVNHIVSNGVPVMIADRVSTKNAIDFIHNVEIAALAAAAAAAPGHAGVTGGGGGGRGGVDGDDRKSSAIGRAETVAGRA